MVRTPMQWWYYRVCQLRKSQGTFSRWPCKRKQYVLSIMKPPPHRMWYRCRDWYVSVGVSSISPTFPESPFTLISSPTHPWQSLSPAVLVWRYSGTPECRSSRSPISELSVCLYLIIVHSTTSQSCCPSLPRAFHGLRWSYHCSSLGLLILDRSHVMAAI